VWANKTFAAERDIPAGVQGDNPAPVEMSESDRRSPAKPTQAGDAAGAGPVVVYDLQ